MPYVWEPFRCEETGTPFLIRIRQSDRSVSSPTTVRWAPCPEDGPGFFAYFEDGRAVFSLRRDESGTAVDTVIHQVSYTALMLSAQFSLMLLLCEHALGLHCASVWCEDRLLALSAPSGTGKTTLAGLLEKQGCETVNGDFALLSFAEDGQVYFEPTPFCGSSGVCLNRRLPLGEVVFLSQAKETRVLPVSFARVMAGLLSNAFVPEWDPGAAENVRCSAVRLAGSVRAVAFPFAPDDAAAKLLLREIRREE